MGFPSARGFLGVLCLDTRFPRLPGDIGNPASWQVPARVQVVPGAAPRDAVCDAQALRGSGLAARFEAGLRELVAAGAVAVTTSCGFLVLLQAGLQAASPVPVRSSSLLLLPRLLATRRRVGVLTVSARHLGEAHLLAAGVPPARLADVPVQGVDPDGEFARVLLGNRPRMDAARARRDVVEAALQLCRREPGLTDLVLECTNMPPHAAAVEAATGLCCWSLLDDEALQPGDPTVAGTCARGNISGDPIPPSP